MHGPESEIPEGRSAMRRMIRAFGWAAACAVTLAPVSLANAGDTAAACARMQTTGERLKQELADQRQLILQLMQAEQQRYDVVLKYLRAGGGGGGDIPALPPPPSPSSVMPKSASSAGEANRDGGVAGHESATVTGKVK